VISLQNDDIREVDLTVQGEIQGVGYRQYVANIGRRLKLAGIQGKNQ
jgi:acylphosphatase